MIDIGFLLGFALGCGCTAALCWWMAKPKRPRMKWLDHLPLYPSEPPLNTVPWEPGPHPLTRHLGAAARSEVADLAVSAGHFISDVRSMRSQIDRAHATLKDATR